jgi:hypothetical protein
VNLEPNNLSWKKGNYKQKSVTICLSGPKMVNLDFAIGAFVLRIPLSISWKATVAENYDEAVKNWLEKDETSHLLYWPNPQQLMWNAVLDGLKEDADRVDMGEARLLRRGGNWEIPIMRADLADQFGIPEDLNIGPRTNPERSLVTCLPSLGRVSLLWMANTLCMLGPIGYINHLSVVTNYPVDEAREELVDRVLAMDPMPAYLLFQGDDMLPPSNGIQVLAHVLDNLVDVEVPAVSGLYHVKHYPRATVAWRSQNTIVEGKDFKSGDLVEVDGTGLDFCLFKTKYLKMVPKPRFKTVETLDLSTTEDVYFWHKFRQATGLRPFVHTGCVVGHYCSKTDFVY